MTSGNRGVGVDASSAWSPTFEIVQRGQPIHAIMDPATRVYSCQFVHHDNRVWSVTATTLKQPEQLFSSYTVQTGETLAIFRSDGCRSFYFVLSRVRLLNNLLAGFRDLRESLYSRLVCDAGPTSTHPVTSVPVVALLQPLVQSTARSGWVSVGSSLPLLGEPIPAAAKLTCDGNVVLLPSAAELIGICRDLAESCVCVFVDECITSEMPGTDLVNQQFNVDTQLRSQLTAFADTIEAQQAKQAELGVRTSRRIVTI